MRLLSTKHVFIRIPNQIRCLYSDRGKDVTAKFLSDRLRNHGIPPHSIPSTSVVNDAIQSLIPEYNQNLPDFRSDTLTVPDVGMFKAMISSPVGDDLHYEDPTTLELERYVADLAGHEDALFCTSGTMTNNLGIRSHLNPLESVIIDARSHVHLWECGGIAFHCQASSIALYPEDPEFGFMNAKQIESNIHTYNHHNQTTKLVIVENTMSGI